MPWCSVSSMQLTFLQTQMRFLCCSVWDPRTTPIAGTAMKHPWFPKRDGRNVIIFILMCCGIASSKLGIISDWVNAITSLYRFVKDRVSYYFFYFLFYSSFIVPFTFLNQVSAMSDAQGCHQPVPTSLGLCGAMHCKDGLICTDLELSQWKPPLIPHSFYQRRRDKFNFYTRGGKGLFHASLTPLFLIMVVFSFFFRPYCIFCIAAFCEKLAVCVIKFVFIFLLEVGRYC